MAGIYADWCLSDLVVHAPGSRHAVDAGRRRMETLEQGGQLEWTKRGRKGQEMVVGSQQLEGPARGREARRTGQRGMCVTSRGQMNHVAELDKQMLIWSKYYQAEFSSGGGD